MITRRRFVGSALAGRRRKVLIALFDGFGPEYLEASQMPVLKSLPRKVAAGMIPSVTNVNNASLVTGTFPEEHGITTNYYYDPATGRAAEMKSPEFLLRPTVLEKAAAAGWKTALVSSKDKVRTLCGRGAAIAVSAEKPEARFVEIAGAQESMYSAAVNYWSLRVARHLLKREGVDLLYLSTTDYMMHTWAPESAESREHLQTVDRMMGEILDDHPEMELYLSADHGMNAKTRALDPVRLLRAQGIAAAAAPLISDTHKVHHQDLGGSYYIYLENRKEARAALDVLREAPEVEEAMDGDRAAREFRLLRGRIGDLFLLAKKDAVFGELEQVRKGVQVRTHGSRHEAAVPVLVRGGRVPLETCRYSLDLTRQMRFERQG